MGWTIPWYSSFDNDFNYDYHVTIDADRGSDVYNYEDIRTLGENWKNWKGEQPGNSAFIRNGDRIFHTYSSYERGCELLMGTLNYLDLTALGRQMLAYAVSKMHYHTPFLAYHLKPLLMEGFLYGMEL